MIPRKISKIINKKKNYVNIRKKYIYYLLVLIIFIFVLFIKTSINLIKINKISNECINGNKSEKLNKTNEQPIIIINSEKNKNSYRKCYLSLDNSNIRIIHLIITRFLLDFYNKKFSKKYREDYIQNGIRVLKKYLFPSLENQSCKNFTWILMLGNTANITYIKTLLTLNKSFESKIIYEKDIKNYMRNITKGFDVLITTRIDYDDRIYYDAVNDVRKAINIYKPMILYGYNRGVYYYEINDKYYDFYRSYKNNGVMSIFLSLITVLNKVNEIYTVYDLGIHVYIRKILLLKYKSYGIKKLDYEPAIFDSGDPKFVWVRQNYSGTYYFNKQFLKQLKENNFNLSKFYGK